MKKTYAFALTAGLFLLGSCAANEPEGGSQNPDLEGKEGYIKIGFNMAETRGSDLTDAEMEDGEGNENTITEATFLFFNKGVLAFQKTVKANYEEGKVQPAWVTTGTHESVASKCAVVKLDKDCDAVTVICNYTPKITGSNTLNNEVINHKNGDNFVMSNAVYINGEQPGTATSEWRATIDPSRVYSTYTEAVTANDVAAVINVERLGAKVRVYSTKYSNAEFDPLAQEEGNKTLDLLNDDVTITFKPQQVGITGTKDGSYILKQITPSSYGTAAAGFFEAINDASNKRCFWCESPLGTSHYAKFSPVANGTNPFNATKAAAKAAPVYVHENSETDPSKVTNVFVAGVYEIKKGDTVIGVAEGSADALAGEEVGTFWLTAFGGKYTVHSTKASVLKAMGIDNDADYELEEDLDDNGKWTGWMKIEGTAVRCLKYSAGAGYYAAPIKRFTINGNDYNAIVRNHIYELSIDKIGGIGVGLPNLDHPIIPVTPPDPNDQTYYMHMSVNVLKWAVVDTQSVKW